MNQVLTLISDALDDDAISTVAELIVEEGLAKEVRVSVAGAELVLNDTDSFTSTQYKEYLGEVWLRLSQCGISSVERQG